jgi:aspartate kinase
MGLIVQKFGGTSVADVQHIFNVATIITKAYSEGNDVVVVVSAQGHTTDDLIAKAMEINKCASKREMDVLLSSGEQISVSLLAMAIESMKFPVISLLGWQAGFHTCLTYGSAKIEKVDSHRIIKELDKKNIVIIAGFQGINECSDITTMGRGGSDTSAVAIAAVMNADICRIYTDVEGIYTSDPKIVKNAKKLNVIDYDEMLELSTLGAQILNNRSVEMAKKYNVEVEVLSSMKDVPGTVVKEMKNLEKRAISGVAADSNIAKVTVTNIPDKPGFAFKLFSKLSSGNIGVDIILQSYGRNNLNDISFTVTKDCLNDTINILNKYISNLENSEIIYDENVSKISIVGTGMETQVGIASKMFEALYEAKINIQMIATSEIKVSVLIDSKDVNLALNSVHDKFFR